MKTTISKNNKSVVIKRMGGGMCWADFMQDGKKIHGVTLVSYESVLKYSKLFFKSV